jgi:DNA-binding SARP family transcriptional activator
VRSACRRSRLDGPEFNIPANTQSVPTQAAVALVPSTPFRKVASVPGSFVENAVSLRAANSLSDLDPGDLEELADQLAHLRRFVDRRTDAALAAMVVAADETAFEWQRQRERAEQLHQEYRLAVDAALGTKQRLAVLVGVIRDFAATPAVTAATTRSGARHRHRLWFGRRRTPPVAVTPQSGPVSIETLIPAPRDGSGARNPDPQVPTLRTPQDDPESLFPGLDRPADRLPTGRIGGVEVQPELVSSWFTADDRSPDPREAEPLASPHASVDVAVQFLGSFRLMQRGVRVELRKNSKSIRVLKYLLAHHDRPIPKEVVSGLFWPDVNSTVEGRNLHQSIYALRKILSAAAPDIRYVLFENDTYLLNPDLSFWSDVEEFEAAAAAGRLAEGQHRNEDAIEAYARAEASYGGEYLMDTPYEDWALGDRERLRLLYIEVTNRLGDLYLQSHNVEAAVSLSRRILCHEPCDEEAHRRLIRCYGVAGHRNLMIRQYDAYVDCTQRLYGLGPSEETKLLYESMIAKETR